MGRLADLIQQSMGGKTRVRFAAPGLTLGIAATRIVPQNADRLGLVITNLSANNVFIAFDNQVSSTHGIFLAPNGGSISMNYKDDFELVGFEVFGLASAAGSNIYYVEVIGERGEAK